MTDAGVRQDSESAQETEQYGPAEPADYAAELEQLAALRDKGILSTEEFEAKKKQVLGI